MGVSWGNIEKQNKHDLFKYIKIFFYILLCMVGYVDLLIHNLVQRRKDLPSYQVASEALSSYLSVPAPTTSGFVPVDKACLIERHKSRFSKTTNSNDVWIYGNLGYWNPQYSWLGKASRIFFTAHDGIGFRFPLPSLCHIHRVNLLYAINLYNLDEKRHKYLTCLQI